MTTVVKNLGGTLAITDKGEAAPSAAEGGAAIAATTFNGAAMPGQDKPFMSKTTSFAKPPTGAAKEETDSVYVWLPLHCDDGSTVHKPIIVGKIWPDTDGKLRKIDETIAPENETGVWWEETIRSMLSQCKSFTMRGLTIIKAQSTNYDNADAVYAVVTFPDVQYSRSVANKMEVLVIASHLVIDNIPRSMSSSAVYSGTITFDINFGTSTNPNTLPVSVTAEVKDYGLSEWHITFQDHEYTGTTTSTVSNSISSPCDVIDKNDTPDYPDEWCYWCTTTTDESVLQTQTNKPEFLLSPYFVVYESCNYKYESTTKDVIEFYSGNCSVPICSASEIMSVPESTTYDVAITIDLLKYNAIITTPTIHYERSTNTHLDTSDCATPDTPFCGCNNESFSRTYAGFETFTTTTPLLFFDVYPVSKTQHVIALITFPDPISGNSFIYFGKATKANNTWQLIELNTEKYEHLKQELITLLTTNNISTLSGTEDDEHCHCTDCSANDDCAPYTVASFTQPVFNTHTFCYTPCACKLLTYTPVYFLNTDATGVPPTHSDRCCSVLVVNPTEFRNGVYPPAWWFLRPTALTTQTYYGLFAANRFVEANKSVWGGSARNTAKLIPRIFDDPAYIINPANPLG